MAKSSKEVKKIVESNNKQGDHIFNDVFSFINNVIITCNKLVEPPRIWVDHAKVFEKWDSIVAEIKIKINKLDHARQGCYWVADKEFVADKHTAFYAYFGQPGNNGRWCTNRNFVNLGVGLVTYFLNNNFHALRTQRSCSS